MKYFVIFLWSVLNIFYANAQDFNDDLIAHWRFNESNVDCKGNHNLIGDITYSCGWPNPIERNCVLDMYNAVNTVETGNIDLGNQFTIAGWYYKSGHGDATRTLFSNADGSGTYGFKGLLEIDNGMAISFATTDGVTETKAITINDTHIEGVWIHFAFLIDRDAGNCLIYVNGEDKTFNNVIRSDFSTSTTLYLGSNPDFEDPRWGYLDDFRIYNRTLSDAEINTLVTGTPPGPPVCELDPLIVSGNKVINKVTGKEVVLKGICYEEQGSGWTQWVPDAEDPNRQLVQIEAHNRHATVYEDFAEMAAWGANCVRMMVMTGEHSLYSIDKDEYMERFLKPQVALAEYFGMYAIIDYHDYCQDEQDDILDFWNHVRQEFYDEDHVIYEILNEPSQTQENGADCCSGGVGTGNDPWLVLKTTAEAAIDVIRYGDLSTADDDRPDALVIVNGLNYGYDLTGIIENPVEKPHVIYGAHPYPRRTECVMQDRGCCSGEQESIWENDFGFASEEYPVMVTEFGWNSDAPSTIEFYGSTEDYWIPLSNYLKKKNIGYLSFYFVPAFGQPPGLALYEADDAYYEPTTMGQAIKDDLHGLPGSVFCNAQEQPPYLAYVGIDGLLYVDGTMNGEYTYRDINGDPEGTSTYKWYLADDDQGTNSQVIAGANSTDYTISPSDQGKFLAFEVIPEANTGVSPGSAVMSSFIGPIEYTSLPPKDIKLNFGNGFCNPYDGWYNIKGGINGTVQLNETLSIELPGLNYGFIGEQNTELPLEVSEWFHFINDWDNNAKEIIVHGLDPSVFYTFMILSSRKFEDTLGTRNTSFTIGSETVSVNSVGNDQLVSIENVTPAVDGSVIITMTKDAGEFGYINALIIETQPEPIAYWPFDGDGTDVSGQDNDIVDLGLTCFDSNAKQGSHGLFFFPETDPVYLGKFDFHNSLTIAFWAKHSYEINCPILLGEREGSDERIRIRYDIGEEDIDILTYNDIDNRVAAFPIKSLVPDLKYHHYIFELDPANNEVRVYIDGEQKRVMGSMLDIPLTNIKLWLGGATSPNTAIYDDVRLFNRPISENQIMELWQSGDIEAPSDIEVVAPPDQPIVNISWEDKSDDETGFILVKKGGSLLPCGGELVYLDENTTSHEVSLDQPSDLPYVAYAVKASKGDYNSEELRFYGFKCQADQSGAGHLSYDSKYVEEGDTITIEAQPDEGWQFKEWTGDITSTESTVSIVMDSPKHVTAVFEETEQVPDRTIKVNFGHSDYPAPADAYWNEITSYSAGSTIGDLIPEGGGETGYSLSLEDPWQKNSIFGHTEGLYPNNVMRTYFYLQGTDQATIRLNDLNNENTYDITIFASRSSYDITTSYTIGDETLDLDVLNNTSETVTFWGISPEDKSINIVCQKTGGATYAYINAMVITEHSGNFTPAPPETPGNYAFIAGINFNAGLYYNYYGDDWYNFNPSAPGMTVNLWEDVTLTDESGLKYGTNGDVSGDDFPDNVALTYHYTDDNNDHMYTLENLPCGIYSLRFFASRNYTGTNRTTHYSSSYSQSGEVLSVDLDADANTSQTANLEPLLPDSEGKIEFSIKKDADSPFGYINALLIHSDPGDCSGGSGGSATGSGSLNAEGQIYIYPNPVKDNLYISNIRANSVIRIYNVLGILVDEFKTTEGNQITISMSGYSPGSYILMITDRDKQLPDQYIVVKE